MSAARTLRLAARARLEGLAVVTPTRRLTAPAEHRPTLERLAGGGVADDASALLDALDGAAALAGSIAIGDGRVTVEPEDDRFRLARAPVEAPLSSLAYARRAGDRVVVRRPGAPARAVLEGAAAVALLASPALPADVAALLAPAGLLAGEEEGWEWHDLVFHARTHGSGPWLRADPAVGPAPPDAKPAMDGETIALAEADLHALAVSDAPLTAVLERRRSLREHDDAHPIDVAELGALLHRAAARRELSTGRDGHERSRRVAPSAGGVSALELYPAVRRCSGLNPGLYHYEADAHRLRRIGDARAGRCALELRPHDAAEPDPQVLVLAALRYPRIAWSYRGIAYQLGLLDLGVLYQSLYLVTTAMGLAGCAYGTADGSGFAALTGISPAGEAALGAFSVGRPDSCGTATKASRVGASPTKGASRMDFMRRLSTDDELRARIKADPAGTLRAEGWHIPDEVDVEVLESTPEKIYLGMPPRAQVDVELTDEQLGAAAGGACASYTCSSAYGCQNC